ncbi:CobQ/CobB/MinD/ParA nucleotide binding domain protein [Leptospira noguchii str. 1993005606]|uniref:ParA family protein n=1 Tax=Leptospira noguchii TaxID=28182 RepID=UPI0002EB74BD|nr:ParA family protein [Leptospira noguchii]EPE82865.1 CobQ/CobB/MinD/ParA nucleotide binding domain protein [Leptospira noguchii str. 1993005606]
MYIVVIASSKGGVGKTTHSTNLAVQLARRGKRILATDLDLNNNLTDFFLRNLDRGVLEERNILKCILGEREIRECIHKSNFVGLDVLPSTLSFGSGVKNLEVDYLLSVLGEEFPKLNYDYIILDTPGHLSVELEFGVVVSDLVLSPVCPKRWSFQGMKDLEEVAEGIVEKLVVVPSLVGRGKQEQERILNLKKKYRVSRASIGKLGSIEKATEEGRELKPGSKGDLWFEALASEVIEIEKESGRSLKSRRVIG